MIINIKTAIHLAQSMIVKMTQLFEISEILKHLDGI